MTEVEARTCPQCGRGQWAGDRYCGACGLDQRADAGDPANGQGASPFFDLDSLGAEASVTSKGDTSGRRRETVLGLAAVLVIVGGLVAIMASASDDKQAVELPAPEPSAAPEFRATGASTDPNSSEPVVAQSAALGVAFRPLELGDGALVALDRGRVMAIDLGTGSAYHPAAPPVQEFLGAYVTGDGLFTPQLSAGRTVWSHWRWDGSDSRTFSAEFDTIAVYTDPTVGPVVVSAGQPPSGDLFFTATAMLSGADRPIEVADPAELLWPRLSVTRSGIRVPDAGFYADDGTTVYSWTWADGWSEFAEGEVAFADEYGVVVFDCDGPTACPARVVGPDGLVGPEFGIGEVRSRLLVSSMQLISPDRSQIAILESDVRPAMERPRIDLLSTATGEKTRIATPDFNWWKIHAWTRDGRYVIATGEAGLAAVEVATGDLILLDTSVDSEFGGVAFLSGLGGLSAG